MANAFEIHTDANAVFNSVKGTQALYGVTNDETYFFIQEVTIADDLRGVFTAIPGGGFDGWYCDTAGTCSSVLTTSIPDHIFIVTSHWECTIDASLATCIYEMPEESDSSALDHRFSPKDGLVEQWGFVSENGVETWVNLGLVALKSSLSLTSSMSVIMLAFFAIN